MRLLPGTAVHVGEDLTLFFKQGDDTEKTAYFGAGMLSDFPNVIAALKTAGFDMVTLRNPLKTDWTLGRYRFEIAKKIKAIGTLNQERSWSTYELYKALHSKKK